MNVTNNGLYIIITADEGKVLTDGSITSAEINAPLNSDISRWREVYAVEDNVVTLKDEVDADTALAEIMEVFNE